MAERHARLAHVHGEPQTRLVRVAGLHLLAQGRRVLAAASATPLDSPIRCIRASAIIAWARRSNGKIVPLDFGLKNGDIVEVLVNKSSARPSLDWLSLVKTSGAKHKIKQWFRKERKEENALLGQEMLEADSCISACAPTRRAETSSRKSPAKLNYSTANDLYAAIGFATRTQPRLPSVSRRTEVDNVVDIQTPAAPTSTRRVARNASGIRIAASTTCWCGSRNAVSPCRAIRSWVS